MCSTRVANGALFLRAKGDAKIKDCNGYHYFISGIKYEKLGDPVGVKVAFCTQISAERSVIMGTSWYHAKCNVIILYYDVIWIEKLKTVAMFALFHDDVFN